MMADCFLIGELEDMDKDWFKTFVMGRNIHKATTSVSAAVSRANR